MELSGYNPIVNQGTSLSISESNAKLLNLIWALRFGGVHIGPSSGHVTPQRTNIS